MLFVLLSHSCEQIRVTAESLLSMECILLSMQLLTNKNILTLFLFGSILVEADHIMKAAALMHVTGNSATSCSHIKFASFVPVP